MSLLGALFSFGKKEDARDDDKEVNELSEKRTAIINVNNRRQALGSIRRQQAQQASRALAGGTAGGSADRATAGSAATQGAANIAQQQQLVDLGADLNGAIESGNKNRSRAADLQAVGDGIHQIQALLAGV